MNNQDRADIKRAQNVVIASNDSSFNYVFQKKENIEHFETQPETIFLHQYDWSVKKDEGDENNLPKLCPLSLASCKDNLEDLEAWFAAKHPRLPSEYHGILARYSSGQLLTKKETKNAIKKMKKHKDRPEPVGLKIANGQYLLDFD